MLQPPFRRVTATRIPEPGQWSVLVDGDHIGAYVSAWDETQAIARAMKLEVVQHILAGLTAH